MFKDPFDPNALLGRRCGCGGDHAETEHGRLVAEAVPAGEEARWNRVVDAAVLRAVFPVDAQRRLVSACERWREVVSLRQLGRQLDAPEQVQGQLRDPLAEPPRPSVIV